MCSNRMALVPGLFTGLWQLSLCLPKKKKWPVWTLDFLCTLPKTWLKTFTERLSRYFAESKEISCSVSWGTGASWEPKNSLLIFSLFFLLTQPAISMSSQSYFCIFCMFSPNLSLSLLVSLKSCNYTSIACDIEFHFPNRLWTYVPNTPALSLQYSPSFLEGSESTSTY